MLAQTKMLSQNKIMKITEQGSPHRTAWLCISLRDCRVSSTLRIWVPKSRVGTWEVLFLTCSQVMQMLLTQGPQSENHRGESSELY